MSAKDQNITDVIEIIKYNVEKYKDLDSSEQDSHLFYLRNALANLISIISYILYRIGVSIEIDVKPSDSIERKIEKILFLHERIFNEDQQSYLSKIIKYRHRIAHNDLYFPNVSDVEKCLEKFKPHIGGLLVKTLEVKETIKALNEKLNEIDEHINKTEQFVSEEVKSNFNHYKEQIITFKSLSLKNSEDLILIGNEVFKIHEKLKTYFPFTREFLDFGLEKYLGLINSPLKLFNRYINELWKCPFCGSDSLTEDFLICEGYNSTAKIEIKSLKPLKMVKIDSFAYASEVFCEISSDGLCSNCHSVNSDILYQKGPPEHSVFCENCGFYFFPNKEVGVNFDFTEGSHRSLFEKILKQAL